MASIKLAIDFDSSYTSIYRLGSGLVLHEPTVAAIDINGKNEIKAFGFDANKLIGKTSENTKVVFPVFEGEIVNVKVATRLLSEFLKKVGVESKLSSVKAVVSVPCGADAEMLKKYDIVFRQAGISKIHYVEAPILSAFGQRIPLSDFAPYFVIDMAGGTTSIATLSLDGIIAGVSLNFGANNICTNIIDYVAEVYGLQIGLLTAERLRKEISSLAEDDTLSTIVNGRDIKTGVPKAITLRALDIIIPTRKYYQTVTEVALEVLKKLPPEVSAEIRHSGIFVSGLASNTYGLENYFTEKFAMKTHIAKSGALAVALGGGTVVGNKDFIEKLAIKLD